MSISGAGCRLRDKDALASDMTELPPTALGQQAAGLIAKVATKEPSRASAVPRLPKIICTQHLAWVGNEMQNPQKRENVKPKRDQEEERRKSRKSIGEFGGTA